MSTYVISDLHGEIGRLHRLYEEIQFGPEDTLYILGDVIDRGMEGVAILQEIMQKDNIHMIMGNHEHMCMRYHSPDVTAQEIARWTRNGNGTTLGGLLQLQKQERDAVLAFISSLQDHLEVEVCGRKYYLVHGFAGDNTHDRIWGRPNMEDLPNLSPEVTLIVGHTPVLLYLCEDSIEAEDAYDAALAAEGKHYEILHAPGFIDIDCCCGYGLKAARLACLRLEDGAEFYV